METRNNNTLLKNMVRDMIVQLPDDVGTHYWPVYNVASNMDNNKRTTRYTWIGLATELSYELRVRRIDSGFDNIDYIFIL